jgi:hypothetical protein
MLSCVGDGSGGVYAWHGVSLIHSLGSYRLSFVKKTQEIYYGAGKVNVINRLLAMNGHSTFEACMVPACPG